MELLRRADLAMYRVKERGKDGTRSSIPHMEDRAVARLDAVNGLRKALERDELVAHYPADRQPRDRRRSSRPRR